MGFGPFASAHTRKSHMNICVYVRACPCAVNVYFLVNANDSRTRGHTRRSPGQAGRGEYRRRGLSFVPIVARKTVFPPRCSCGSAPCIYYMYYNMYLYIYIYKIVVIIIIIMCMLCVRMYELVEQTRSAPLSCNAFYNNNILSVG